MANALRVELTTVPAVLILARVDADTNGFHGTQENMSEFKQSRVSRVVWNWTAPANPNADTTRRRAKALTRGALMIGVAVLVGFVFHAWHLAAVAFGLCGLILVSGLWIPRLFDALECIVAKIAWAIGAAMTWLLLTPFFYFFFVPVRLLLLLRGRDPLHRRFPSEEPTYWHDHPRPKPGWLTRQF
ncbi:MAG: hypothetical protein N2255_02285 [Kiritimatiellae bacterium]|nr:hypothetical protein [Kiritimatiellia bacterium]